MMLACLCLKCFWSDESEACNVHLYIASSSGSPTRFTDCKEGNRKCTVARIWLEKSVRCPQIILSWYDVSGKLDEQLFIGRANPRWTRYLRGRPSLCSNIDIHLVSAGCLELIELCYIFIKMHFRICIQIWFLFPPPKQNARHITSSVYFKTGSECLVLHVCHPPVSWSSIFDDYCPSCLPPAVSCVISWLDPCVD